MFTFVGLAIAFVGLLLMRSAREREGIGGVFFFLVSLVLLLMGLYLAFIEEGEGLRKWMPFL